MQLKNYWMNLKNSKIAITGFGAISPLGVDRKTIWKNYLTNDTFIQSIDFKGKPTFCAPLSEEGENQLSDIKSENKNYKHIDRTALLAIYAARQAVKEAGWRDNQLKNTGVSLGSSRGATQTWEHHHFRHLQNENLSPLASPTTTLGSISSWVVQDQQFTGPSISHSMTCTTGLHAIANGMAWIKGGLCEKFLCGGSEASITPFTIAQFKSLGLYTKEKSEYPCRPYSIEEKNTLCIGEGSAVFALELMNNQHELQKLATILSVGFGMEKLTSSTSISYEGKGFEQSMRNALENANIRNVDAIISHAPGTIDGDESELKAIYKVFGELYPIILSNKWKIGHTFGASSVLSLEQALYVLQYQKFTDYPYNVRIQLSHKPINTIMINAAGFGGNCVSMIVSR